MLTSRVSTTALAAAAASAGLLLLLASESSGNLLAIGGSGVDTLHLTSVELLTWDNRRCLLRDANRGRRASAGHLVGDTHVYVCGGTTDSDFSHSRTCDKFDISMQAWSESFPMQTCRAFLSIVKLGNDVIYALGGENELGQVSTTEYMVEEQQKWEEGLSLSIPLEASCAVAVNSTSFVITGGSSGDFSRAVEIYNTDTGRWFALPEMRVGRYDHGCAAADHNGKRGIMVAGGSTLQGPTESVEFLEISSSSWVDLPSLNSPREALGLGLLDNKPTVLGGFGNRETEQLVGESWVVVPELELAEERSWFALVNVPSSVLDCE